MIALLGVHFAVNPLITQKKIKVDFVCSLCYLEHVCVVVMAVLHHHGLVSGQGERDAVLPPAVHRLQQQQQQQLVIFWKLLSFHLTTHILK